MRILVVSNFDIATDGHGYGLQLAHLLDELSGDHQLSIVAVGSRCSVEVPHTLVAPAPEPSRARRLGWAAASMVGGDPAIVRQAHRTGVEAAVRAALAAGVGAGRFDVAHVTDSPLAFVAGALGQLPRLVVPIDAWHHKHVEEARVAGMSSAPFTAGAIRRYERAMLARFDAAVVVAEEERRALLTIDPTARVEVIPNGVDAAAFAPPPGVVRADDLVVFHGALDYGVNIDAAEFLIGNVLPRIRASLPDVRVRLAGRNPAARVRALAGTGVEVTGPVTDMAACLASAAVGVYPMRYGTGIKNKVLEAAAAGLAVVTTGRGLGDIDLLPGSEVLVADDAAGLAAAAVQLLRSPARRAAMGAAARARIASSWTWAATARAFADLYADVAAHPTRSATWR